MDITWTPRARSSVRRTALALVPLAALVGTSACRATPPPPPPTPGPATTVVFDIDGTLTDDDISTTPHPGALAAVDAYVDKGYQVVYVTARWDAVQRSSTESWLAANGFPDLPLYMSSSLLLTDASKVDYKTETLTQIEGTTGEVVYAYGDSSSDFDAYENVGVPVSQVFALQRASATSCQPGAWAACLPDYTGHLGFIATVPSVG